MELVVLYLTTYIFFIYIIVAHNAWIIYSAILETCKFKFLFMFDNQETLWHFYLNVRLMFPFLVL